MEIEVTIGGGNIRKDRAFELTKDGFMLLVMGFTGEKAMAIKLAYINAFNWMAEQLSTAQHQPTLALPEPPSITKAQAGELFHIVANKARTSGKPNAYYWSRFQNHFKLASYKDLPAERFDEASAYLLRLEGENAPLLTLSPDEIEAMVAERVKAVEGELLQRLEPAPVVPARLNGQVTMHFQDGKIVGAYSWDEQMMRVTPDSLPGQLREIPWFTATHLRQIAEVCLERLGRMAVR